MLIMPLFIFITNFLALISIIILSNFKLLQFFKPNFIKQIGLFTATFIIYIIIYYSFIFNSSIIGFQFIQQFCGIWWGIDGISLVLIILTALLIPLALLSNYKNIKFNQNLFVCIILILSSLLIFNFICLDIFTFYILFEATLPPLFLLIGIWGAKAKVKAANYVLLFTLGSSLFMLLSIALLIYILNTGDYLSVNTIILSLDLQCVLWFGLFIGIAVKAPLMPVHVWLPIVHSESPLAGSILLAGVILKLAIYAIIRLLLTNLNEASIIFTPFIFVIATLTIIFTSLITLRQTDLKVIIAYSSIGHLSVCLLGVFSNNIIGFNGSVIMCLAHGFISPALFICVGGVLYDRYHTRLLHYFQGLSTYMPLFSTYFVIFSFCNIGTPLSANFLGEFLSLIGAFNRLPLIGCLAVSSVLLSACYQMKLTNKLTGGYASTYLIITKDITKRELLLFNLLLLPTLFIGIFPKSIIQYLNLASSTYLYHL